MASKEIRFVTVGFPVGKKPGIPAVDRLAQGEVRLLRQTEKETGSRPRGARVVGPAWLVNTWTAPDKSAAHVKAILGEGGKFRLYA